VRPLTAKVRGAIERKVLTHPVVERALIRQFSRLYYYAAEVDATRTWRNTHWLGTPVLKCPLDLWLYQELLAPAPADLIVETGTNKGGSALFLAQLCELVGRGQVVTIDIEPVPGGGPRHPRLEYVVASSTAPETVADMRRRAEGAEKVMVILDSDHSASHVLDELRAYADLVTVGSHLMVEDTNVNGHPVAPEFGPGPMEAVDAFLAEDDRFEVDPSGGRFLLTLNPRGLLRRVR
jgi:cephalosporin hydroxylase